jgi:hypothetical protein
MEEFCVPPLTIRGDRAVRTDPGQRHAALRLMGVTYDTGALIAGH